MAADPLEPGALEADEEVTARGVRVALDTSPELQVRGITEVISPTRAMIEASASSALVVIGTRGHGPIAGALLGSVAFAVAARAECPVVVIGGEAARRPIGPRWPVVVGTDGSEPAAAAVAFAADWALADSAALEVVTCTGDHPFADADPEALRAAAETIARTAADRLRTTHPTLIVTTRVEDSMAQRTLIDTSADAGLVVIGTRGRGAFTGMVLGSVSHAVIHGADCPVAVVGEGQHYGPR
jgi:nucleotide-binding universal stress UspA family protein